eukprot:11180172-Lingulodinium_polyedra.AAC.1
MLAPRGRGALPAGAQQSQRHGRVVRRRCEHRGRQQDALAGAAATERRAVAPSQAAAWGQGPPRQRR